MTAAMSAVDTNADAHFNAVASAAHNLLGKDAFEFNREELRSVVSLAAACERLVSEGDALDTQSEKGSIGCRKFLRALEKLATSLSLEVASRAYRAKFAPNFRALFSGEDRSYRVDVLEAAMSPSPALWANGEAYQLGEAAVTSAAALREAWLDLYGYLDKWTSPDRSPGQVRNNICERLSRLDAAWAGFEEAYVDELQNVQQHARTVLKEAAEQEHRLRKAEKTPGDRRKEADWEAHRHEEMGLLEHLANLSTAAELHPRAKPHVQNSDLSVQVLDDAVQVLAITGCSKRQPDQAPDPAVVMASRAVETYNDMRDYLGKVQEHMDKVHPQLCHNKGLAEKLGRWEESWERSAHYAQNPVLMEGIRYLVGFLAMVLQIVPSLQQMFEDRDAELFLVLPRLVCLCLLSDPEGAAGPLAHQLMNNRFTEPGPADEDHEFHCTPSDEVQKAASSLTSVLELIQSSTGNGSAAQEQADEEESEGDYCDEAWDVLLNRAVAGEGSKKPEADDGLYAELEPARREQAAAAVESLMHEVEGWSMELQRHSPEAWNDLSDLLVQCMVWAPPGEAATAEEATASKFVT